MDKEPQPLSDASHLYEVERTQFHAQRPGFRIIELQISPTQSVPWHYHNHIQDTFYIIEGALKIYVQNPEEEITLAAGETFSVRPRRPHLVTNAGTTSTTFLVLQGIGEYDFVPLNEQGQ